MAKLHSYTTRQFLSFVNVYKIQKVKKKQIKVDYLPVKSILDISRKYLEC
jgi:hypothetical protein